MPSDVDPVLSPTNASTDTLLVRLQALEKAQELFREDIVRVPTSVDKSALALRELLEAKMTSGEALSVQKFIALTEAIAVFKDTVNGRFGLNAEQTDKAARDVKSAVDAAFAAAKEAVGEQNKSNALSITKSEAATAEAIKQGQQLFQTAINSLTTQVNDIKSRLDKGEGGRVVSDPALAAQLAGLAATVNSLNKTSDQRTGASTQSTNNTSLIIAIIGILVAMVAAYIASHH